MWDVCFSDRDLSLCSMKLLILFKVQNMFGKHVDRGVLEVISPPQDFYPNLTALRPTLGDEPERVQWRSKQVSYIFYR